ncbi:MAG: radical SAM protein [bacterium]|nr:radical SAM protein [bacterium]
MPDKPTILFLQIIHSGFEPFDYATFGLKRNFDLLPHKYAVLTLVAWIREHGCEGFYTFIDPTDPNGVDKISASIDKIKPDALGFSLCSDEIRDNYMLIEKIKARHPDIPIIVGGRHVTALPEHSLKNFPLIDFIGIGEGERTLEEFLKVLKAGGGSDEYRKIDGLGFRDENGNVVITSPRQPIEDINTLPDPAYDLLIDSDNPPGERSGFPLVCSYGCYFHCTFCGAEHGHYRFINPEKVVDRIERAKQKYGIDYFAMRDSFWPPSIKWMEEFCDILEKRDLEIEFQFLTRVRTLTRSHLLRLKKLGVRTMMLGVEAGDPEILKAIKKQITIEQARESFDILNEIGIYTVSFFMVGNQGENLETVKTSIKVANELNASIAYFSHLAPFPGSEVYDLVKDEDKEWWRVGAARPSVCDLTSEELDHLATEAFLRYPLRWRWFRQHVLFGHLPAAYRKVAWKYYRVHLRKYLLGIAERVPFFRGLIKMVKKVAGK